MKKIKYILPIFLFLSLFFIYPSLTNAAVSIVQSVPGSNNFGGTVASTAFSSNNTAGNTIVVLIQWQSSGVSGINSVTDSRGNNYTLITASLKSTGPTAHYSNIYTQIAYATNVAAGPNTVTVTWNNGVNAGFASLLETSPSSFDQSSTGTGTSANPSAGSITTSVNGVFATAVLYMDDGFGGGNVFAPGAGWTIFQNVGGGSSEEAGEYAAQSLAGSISGNFSSTISGTWVASMATFVPNGGGSPTPTPTPSPSPAPSPTPTPSPTPVGGTNIYIAQSQTGMGDGSSCANALAYTFFNSASNWGNSSAQIGQGKTVHVCGTITASLIFHGSGIASAPIKLVWEPGAKISQPYCVTACVSTAGYDYLILDGGTNGIIENTANGSLLTYQKWSTAIDANGCDGCEIKNIHIQNLYIHAYADEAIDNTAARGIEVSGNNWLIHGNVLHDVMWAIMNEYASGNSGGRIYNNEIYNVDHAFSVLGSGAITVGPFYIYNNYVHDYAIWDTAGGHWHHDGIHAFGTGSGGGCPLVTELWIYNNLFAGDTGDNMTSHTFLEGGGCDGVHTPWTTGGGRAIVFNNVLIGTPGRLVYGLFQTGDATGNLVYNNTVIGNNPTIGSALIVNNAPNFTFKNNFISGSPVLIGTGGTTTFKSAGSLDNNVYANCAGSNCFSGFGLFTSNFTSWKTASGGDANSIATIGTDGGVGATGVPQIGSSVIGTGANLTSLGIAALNSDKASNARPATGPWDIGAYQYVSSGGNPTPIPGDFNLDHTVNSLDFSLLNSKWFQSYSAYDLYVDGIINSLDYAIMSSNWGKTW